MEECCKLTTTRQAPEQAAEQTERGAEAHLEETELITAGLHLSTRDEKARKISDQCLPCTLADGV